MSDESNQPLTKEQGEQFLGETPLATHDQLSPHPGPPRMPPVGVTAGGTLHPLADPQLGDRFLGRVPVQATPYRGVADLLDRLPEAREVLHKSALPAPGCAVWLRHLEVYGAFSQKELTEEEWELTIRVLYENWKGTTSWRHLLPLAWYYGATQWHPQPGYLLTAVDLEGENKVKDFSMSGVKDWSSGPDLPARWAAHTTE